MIEWEQRVAKARTDVWIETRGRQLRVRWRAPHPTEPDKIIRDYEPFEDRDLAEAYKKRVKHYSGRPPELPAPVDGPDDRPTPGLPCSLTRWSTYAIYKQMPRIREPRTRRDYLSHVTNTFVPLFGEDADVGDVKWVAILEWITDMVEEGLNPKTIRNKFYVLHAVLDLAVEHEMIAVNPLTRKSKHLPPKIPNHLRPLNRAEYRALYFATPERYRPVIRLLVATGLRWGELAGLRVVDVQVEADEPHLDIQHALKRTRDGKYVLGLPKTAAAIRSVPLDPDVVPLLIDLCKGKAAFEYVFTSTDGMPLRHQNFYGRVWLPAIKAAGLDEQQDADGTVLLPSLRIHDLRHTYVNWQLEASPTETTLSKVSTWIGHTSYAFTKDVYGRWVRPDSSKEMAAMARMTRFDDSNVVAIAG